MTVAELRRLARRLRLARQIVNAAARHDLVRGGAWNDLDDGQREDWMYVAKQVIG